MIADNGNNVVIITTHNKNRVSYSYIHEKRIKVWLLPRKYQSLTPKLHNGLDLLLSYYNPIYLQNLKKILELEKPDIVHAHNLISLSLYSLKLAKQIGAKTILTFHGYFFECPRGTLFKKSCVYCYHKPLTCKLHSVIYKRIMKYCDHIIAINPNIRDRLIRLGYDIRKITLLQNSVALKIDSREIHLPPKKEILFVGRMSREKGVEILLKALARVKNDFFVNIIGEGKDKAYFEKLAQLFQDKVKFLGYVPDNVLKKYYERAYFVVLPSTFPELCPLVPLEAISYGKPVIASYIGGMPYLIVSGETGFLFEPGNVNNLAYYIDLLLGDEELATKMSKRAREFSKNFSSENHLKSLLKIYKIVLKG